MKIGAGIAGILLGLFSLLYVGLFGGMIGSAAGWLGSLGPHGNSTITNWASIVSLLSWLAPLLAIIGGIVAFSNPRAGGVILAASACLLWYLLGFGMIGKLFVLPIGATALLAFFAAPSTPTELRSAATTATSSQGNSFSNAEVASFDRAKWNALVQYDQDIASIAERLKLVGQKWLDEFASSYLALNDKQYLPDIEQKIVAAAKAEAEENQQTRIRLEEQRMTSLHEQERLAQERKMQLQLWRDRIWGTGLRRTGVITACVLILTVAAVSYLYVTAPPPRPTDRIVWSGAANSVNCFDIECLRRQMQKSGANIEAIQFAERLSASSYRGATAWSANGIHHFGHMDIVTFSGPNETRGLVFVDRDLRIIDPNVTDFVATLRSFSAFTVQHPRAFVIGRPEFVGTTELPDERIRFSLQYPIADCMACEPLAALQVPWDFNKAGRAAGMEPASLRPWSQRLPTAQQGEAAKENITAARSHSKIDDPDGVLTVSREGCKVSSYNLIVLGNNIISVSPYKGGCKEGLADGQGSYTFVSQVKPGIMSGNVKGKFRNGKLNGNATFNATFTEAHPDNVVLSGEFRENRPWNTISRFVDEEGVRIARQIRNGVDFALCRSDANEKKEKNCTDRNGILGPY